MGYMIEKSRKTLYLPNWIISLLDVEARSSKGPGVIAAASILAFCRMSEKAKKKVLKKYSDCEIEYNYAIDDEASAAQPLKADEHSLKRPAPSKAG